MADVASTGSSIAHWLKEGTPMGPIRNIMD